MKHYYLATLLVAATALGASAQNVTIVGKDGINTKFNVDYVQEITFEQLAPEGFVEFTSVKATPNSSGGAATLNFGNEDGSVTMQLFVFGTSNALYLQDGAYNVSPSNLPNTVDTDPDWSFINDNGTMRYLKEGTMVVESGEGKYTINMEFTLEDGSLYQAIYKGSIDNYSRYLRYTATDAYYKENMAGIFKILITNENPTEFELQLYVLGDGDAKYLVDGRYPLSEKFSDVNIIYGKDSYLDLFYPNSIANKFASALMNVSSEGSDKVLSIDLELKDGRTVHIDYKGEIR